MSSATSPVPGPGSVRAPRGGPARPVARRCQTLVEQVDVARRERVERDDRDRLILAVQPGRVKWLDLVGARDGRRQEASAPTPAARMPPSAGSISGSVSRPRIAATSALTSRGTLGSPIGRWKRSPLAFWRSTRVMSSSRVHFRRAAADRQRGALRRRGDVQAALLEPVDDAPERSSSRPKRAPNSAGAGSGGSSASRAR